MPICDVCHNHCNLTEGATGLCKARICKGNTIISKSFGLVTSIALDPIEKKPLNLFYPDSNIISVGSFGCNLRCPFCQNHEISYGFDKEYEYGVKHIAPDELAEIAESYKPQGNIGVAFTYNEPLIGYEYVIDAAKEVHKRGMKTVLVSNGCVTETIASQVIPHIDAMNIDLKGFTDSYYRDVLGGDRGLVMDFIKRAVSSSHVEVTTLIIPGYNDSDEEMRKLSKWISDLNDGEGRHSVPLHISRYFPRFKMNIPATEVESIYHLRDVAREMLDHVFTGNC
ncbi:AmmeMemoRadiSam system radical SAM enzyme [Butyrivibrio sp. AE2032]|uniref:AmmeMemoRadiSam system radical SAM enzyme n=1 Tax=Butyrivibrio sp. AE2032 TaxID=1458463 RepID=UPI000558B676|nr:AmmeMemoRadiSam system radical SAM enzyme [Butyrivibrio sp. AE2032]